MGGYAKLIGYEDNYTDAYGQKFQRINYHYPSFYSDKLERYDISNVDMYESKKIFFENHVFFSDADSLVLEGNSLKYININIKDIVIQEGKKPSDFKKVYCGLGFKPNDNLRSQFSIRIDAPNVKEFYYNNKLYNKNITGSPTFIIPKEEKYQSTYFNLSNNEKKIIGLYPERKDWQLFYPDKIGKIKI